MKPECLIGQPFGANYNGSYAAGGLKGHTGVDNSCGYGTPIHSLWDKEYVYKVLTKENPANDGSGFTGIFTLVEQDGELFEFLYGHCDPNVTIGQILTKGTVIGTEANNGEVYAGNMRITLEMQKSGDHRGAHRHDQKRLVKKTPMWVSGKTYLTDNNGIFFKDGNYYEVINPNNGYNGCVDWTLGQFYFNNDLYFGMKSDDVYELQKRLVKEGYGTFEPTGFFGPLTVKATIAYQKAKHISPALGYVGKLTRAELNK